MTTINKMTYDDRNPGPVWDRLNKVAGFNRLMEFKPSGLAKDNPNYHVPNSQFRYVLIRNV
jgi:hypothetical protein